MLQSLAINDALLSQITALIGIKHHLKQLPQYLGQLEEIAIYLVDGDRVRNDYFMDYNSGGHSLVYGLGNTEYPNVSFIPPQQIWLDAHLDRQELILTLYHEYQEYRLMEKGMSYEEAHSHANQAEQELLTYLGKNDFVEIAQRKLQNLNLQIPFDIKYIDGNRSSECLERQGLILFNFEDAYNTDLAIQGSVFLLLHEIGHLFYYQLQDQLRYFTELFGNPNAEYRNVSVDDPNFISKYGASQPLEEFAEIFALYVYYGNYQDTLQHLRMHHKTIQVIKKLCYLEYLIKKYLENNINLS